MQRYFQQDELQALGLSQFDAWANQFAVAEPGLEMTPDGSGFRMNTRFRKFVNVPELMKLFLQVADLQQFGSTTGIERPDLYNGKPVNVVSDGGPDLKEFVNSLAERTEKIRTGLVDPRDDNMLLITGEGRKAALDLSLVRPTPPDASKPKVDALVDILASIYEASQAVKGTQLVFCDLATPKPKR
jgi:N12 class adenine-specific DNA methylase